MEEKNKDFSWKWYIVLVTIVEIITIFLTYRISLNTHNSNDWDRIGMLPIWLLNSLIIYIASRIQFIKYKKYKANGYNVIANVIVSIFSAMMIATGIFMLNLSFYTFLEPFVFITTSIVFLILGIALIFPVFQHKEKHSNKE